MAEYIEKQALLKKMYASHSVPLLISQTTDEDIMFKTMVSIVEEQPTADVVEVKHGEWIKSIHKETPIIKDGRLFEKEHEVFCCSVCDVKIVGLRNMSFCPFCGAKMDGERKCDND